MNDTDDTLVVEGELSWDFAHGDSAWITINGRPLWYRIGYTRSAPIAGGPWGKVRITIEWAIAPLLEVATE